MPRLLRIRTEMIDPTATGTVKRPSADLRRPRGWEALSAHPPAPVDDTPRGSLEQRAENTSAPATLPPEAFSDESAPFPGRHRSSKSLLARGLVAESPRPQQRARAGGPLVQVTLEPSRPDAVAPGLPVDDPAPLPIPRRLAAPRSKARGAMRMGLSVQFLTRGPRPFRASRSSSASSRPSTDGRRQQEQLSPFNRLKPGEKKHSKRMATVAAVYAVAPFVLRQRQM